MKNKGKHRNEILAAIVLTGAMLFVPMSNYASNGVTDGSYGTINTVAGDTGTADDGSTAIGDGSVATTDSVAVGKDTNAEETSTAVGTAAEANSDSVAVGNGSYAEHGSSAVGNDAIAKENGTAVGNGASGDDGTAVGNGAIAQDEGTAVGKGANARNNGTAVGNGSTSSVDSAAVGINTIADKKSTAIGSESKAYSGSIAIGLTSYADVASTAVGNGSRAEAKSTAVGYTATAKNGSIAVGTESNATEHSIAVGMGASASYNSVAIGNNSAVVFNPDNLDKSDLLRGYIRKFNWDAVDDNMDNGIVSIGYYGANGSDISRRLTHVANGRVVRSSTDAVNGGQLYAVWKDLYDKIINADPDADPGTDLDPVTDSDFQLVNGQDTIIDKNGNAISVAGETTGYRADENGNISLQVTDPGDGTVTKQVVITDVASAQKLNEVDERVMQNTQNIEGLKQSVNQLDGRIDRVGAGAAALAALHPLDFDPDAKWDFAAGYGNYRGANAIALGTYYRPNETTMFSIGGSFGGGENMVNAGISIKIGSGSGYALTSRVAMAKTIKTMQEEMNKERMDRAKERTNMTTKIRDMAKTIEAMQKEMDAMKVKNV